MPIVKTIGSITIHVYIFDHPPPHFHAKYVEYEELIVIETLETYSGNLPSKQRKKVIKWATDNKGFLIVKWNEVNL